MLKRLDLQILPKRIAYKREFDEIKYISLLIKDDELLERYNETWGKISIKQYKKEFDSGPVYNEKYLKAKIKP